ncbi:MAG: sigma-70 family RNA polymerase sigma factor [Candidatus Kerfeldbacteria bacterium]
MNKQEANVNALELLRIIRNSMGNVSKRGVRSIAKKRGWLGPEFGISQWIDNVKFKPLGGSEFHRVTMANRWLKSVIHFAGNHGGIITYVDLEELVKEARCMVNFPSNPARAVKKAFMIFMWFWTAQKMNNFELVEDGSSKYPSRFDYLMQSNKRWIYFLRIRHDNGYKAKVKQQFMLRYLFIVNSVATRLAMGFPRSVELKDLIHDGVIGLSEAIDEFNPYAGVKFQTYATPRIRGAILDSVRMLDWVPRSTRSSHREIEKTYSRLLNDLGDRPEMTELIAEKMGITPERLLLQMADLKQGLVLSLDEIIYRENDNRQVPRIETISSDLPSITSVISKQQVVDYVLDAIKEKLNFQQSSVIYLYYFEEMTLREIGEVLSVSESRASQVHTLAIRVLRKLCLVQFKGLRLIDLQGIGMDSVRIDMTGNIFKNDMPDYAKHLMAVAP